MDTEILNSSEEKQTPKESTTPPKEKTSQQINQNKSKDIKHTTSKEISLSEDNFGTLYDDNGYPHAVKRFTWKNHNKIEVQIITYGARITSMKIPDRKGTVVDVALGFDDLAGYLYYDNHFVGATIGRVTNRVENSTFAVENKQYWLTKNEAPHHFNGGNKGFDKVIWNHFVQNNKVVLTYLSPDKEEGYPGDLLVKIGFELTSKNEFKIEMEAVTTKPTIVNLSNMNYINLAGHNTGPEEIYKHILSINANCYTLKKENGLPTGEIMNVNWTKNDFQIPKILSNVIGIEPDDGFDQNLCINRGVEQGNCFVVRLLHVPSGRLMEIYSNQNGINFYTADRFGSGALNIPIEPMEYKKVSVEQVESPFDLVDKLHEKVKHVMKLDKENDYSELRSLIRKLQSFRLVYEDEEEHGEIKERKESKGENKLQEGEEIVNNVLLEGAEANGDQAIDLATLKLTPFQLQYLDEMKDISEKVESVTDYSEIREIIEKILKATNEFGGQMEGVEAALEEQTKTFEKTSMENDRPDQELQMIEGMQKRKSSEPGEVNREDLRRKSQDSKRGSIRSQQEAERRKSELEKELKRKGMIIPENKIPSFYKDGRVHGKGGCIYVKHGAVCLQTQNYPNAIYHKNFPSCVLKPGETYSHTIVYKFYKQAGNPNKWIKQYNHDRKKQCVEVSKPA